MFLYWFLLGGLSGRIRGGAGNEIVRKLLNKPEKWELPNTLIRSIWALSVVCLFYSKTNNLGFLPAVFIFAFLGTLHGYWGDFDLNRRENRNTKNYLRLTIMAILRCTPLFIVFSQTSFFLGSLAGFLFVPAYLLGNLLNRYFNFMGNTQWGEFIIWGTTLTLMSWGL